MPIHAFARAALVPASWKNGGGVTREIVCQPPGAGTGDFDWRVSIATIAASGPFSTFPGIDRVIVLLDGAGVRLRSADGRLDHTLDVPLSSFVFDGEQTLACTLLGAESTDFNVMTRRAVCRAEVRVVRGAEALAGCERGLLFAVRGAWRLREDGPADEEAGTAAMVLAAGAGMWWDEEPRAWQLAPVEGDAALLAVRLWPRADGRIQ